MQMRNQSLLPAQYPTTVSDKHPPISKKHSTPNLNIQINPNFANFDSLPKKPISPTWDNKGGFAIANAFDDEYVMSTTSIHSNQMHLAEQRSTKSFRNIQTMFGNDPQKQEDWKGKYQLLYKKYQQMAQKYESKIKQGFKMQQAMIAQDKTIEKLEEEIFQLNNRLMDSQTNRNQKWNNSFNSHHNGQLSYGNERQANRFYVEELERSIDGLQRENRRLSETLMRKFKNSFDY